MIQSNKNQELGLTVHARTDGSLEAAYLRLSKNPVIRTEEVVESALLLDFDDHDKVVGVEILAPVRLDQVLQLAGRLDADSQSSFLNFVRSSAPPALVTA